MGWSSSGYSYTKDEIGPSAFAAGCGSGWFWIHKRPNMFIKGYINDDGNYELTFYKPNNSSFPYTIQVSINEKQIINLSSSSLHTKYKQQSASGSLYGATEAHVLLKCGAPSCDVGANGSGKIIISTDLYPYAGVFLNGKWHKAYVYINVNGQWKLVKFTIFHNGQWRRAISI